MSGRESKTGVIGVTFRPEVNLTYPYMVRWHKKVYGFFHTMDQAAEYLELVKRACAGEGEMPEPVKQYRIHHGMDVKWHHQKHECVAGTKPVQQPVTKAKPKKKSDTAVRCCLTCKWRSGMDSTKAISGSNLYCKYGLQDDHHTRLYLHYQRTGTSDLRTLTKDKNCTEWEPRAR